MAESERHAPFPKRVTIRDVARASGTSISTVSVALSGRPGVSDKTRTHVLDVANQLGWRPDRRASNLRRNDIRQVGVVYEAESVFQARLLDALYVAAEACGLQLVLAAATAHHDERKCINLLLQERCQALILTGSGVSSSEIHAFGRRLPTISLCRYVHEPGIDTVVSDDDMGYSALIDHLVSLGHRDIAHVDGGAENLIAERRRSAYENAMCHNGLEQRIQVLSGGTTISDGARVARTLMSAKDLPSAVTCYNDEVGAGLVRTLRSEGVVIPQDLSVAGYDDGPNSADPSTSLTTVVQDPVPLARVTMNLARKRIDTGVNTQPGEEDLAVLPTSLVVRSTTGLARYRA